MKRVFADTFYFLALLNKKDEAHHQTVAFSQSFKGVLVTTDFVMLELADALAATGHRDLFATTRDKLRKHRNVLLVNLSDELFEEGIGLYVKRLDKKWSLTDCTSFVVMRKEGITESLTGDGHFEQAGFVALLK